MGQNFERGRYQSSKTALDGGDDEPLVEHKLERYDLGHDRAYGESRLGGTPAQPFTLMRMKDRIVASERFRWHEKPRRD